MKRWSFDARSGGSLEATPEEDIYERAWKDYLEG